MNPRDKVTFKPDLSAEEQTNQRILESTWKLARVSMSLYGMRLNEWFTLDWDIPGFLKWFREIVESDFGRWRRENLDTSDIRAGTDWRCFRATDNVELNELWLEFPRPIRMSIFDKPAEIRTFIMCAEMWTRDHLRGEAMGPAIWLTLRAKPSGTGLQAHLGCEDWASNDPLIEQYYWALRGMLDGTLSSSKVNIHGEEQLTPAARRAAALLALHNKRAANPPGPRQEAATAFVEGKYQEGLTAKQIFEDHAYEIRRLRAEVDKNRIEVGRVQGFIETTIKNYLRRVRKAERTLEAS